MPRGVRLSQEEKDRRAAVRAAKGLAPLAPYVRKFGPAKRPKSAEEKALIKANKDAKKIARNFAKLEKQMKVDADFALLRSDPVAYKAQKKAERKAKSDARKYYGTSRLMTGFLSTPSAPRAPRASKPDFIGPLTRGQTYYRQRKLRALQVLADDIPLPMSPSAPSRRVRVVRQYDNMGRPRINSRVANQAM